MEHGSMSFKTTDPVTSDASQSFSQAWNKALLEIHLPLQSISMCITPWQCTFKNCNTHQT